MRKIIILLCFLPFSIHSQSGFNLIYEFDGNSTSATFHDVTNINDTLVVIGTSFNPITLKWDLQISQIDSLGNIFNTYKKENEDGFNMVESEIIKTNDDGYLIIGNMDHSKKGVVLKLDHNMEEMFFKIVYDSINRTFFHREAVEVSDGYIIGSDIQMLSYDNQAWAMKLDYDGNEVWYHQYGVPDTSELVYDMDVMPDGNVIIVGIKTNIDDATPENFWTKLWTLIINSETGEVIKERTYDRYAEEGRAFAIHSMLDGTYLTGMADLGDEEGFSKLSLRRLDNDGNLVWKRRYGPDIHATVPTVYKIMPIEENRFIAIGRGKIKTPAYPTANLAVAITICFNPEDGEEYWVRTDTIPIDTINNTNNYVQGGTVLSSGSVVVAGYNNTGRAYGWLLKMDKNGCIQDDCETYTAVEDVREAVALPVLFPNPAERYFNIKGEHEGDIAIYSVSGQLVKVVAENLTFGDIGVGDLPKGLYFVRGQTSGRVWVLKLVR